MADNKTIQKAKRDGMFESPVGERLTVAGTKLILEGRGRFDITIGNEALEGLKKLGVNERADGTMAIPAHNTREVDRRESKVAEVLEER